MKLEGIPNEINHNHTAKADVALEIKLDYSTAHNIQGLINGVALAVAAVAVTKSIARMSENTLYALLSK